MIKIISKSYCPYCDAAKQFLDSIDKEYEVIDVTNDNDKLQEAMAASGMMTVPQIFDGEMKQSSLIGGYDDMMKKYQEGTIFRDEK